MTHSSSPDPTMRTQDGTDQHLGSAGESDTSRTLEEWQLAACDAWERGDSAGPHRGTLEIFTGGGKSLIALECLRRAERLSPGLRCAIVVPTLALARQWRAVIEANTALLPADIGSLDGDHKDELQDHQILVAVLNSAAEHLPSLARQVKAPLMLIIDECHRAGAPGFSRVLHTGAQYRLGLSATAERDDVDDDGIPIAYDQHVLGQLLGDIVYSFDLRDARRIGWLPDFTVHHHAVTLTDAERRTYEDLTRRVDDLLDRLQQAGVESSRARTIAGQPGEVGSVAKAYVGAVSLRKDLLYRATERARVVTTIMRTLADRSPRPRVLLFHERISEAAKLHDALTAADLGLGVGLEHSRMPESVRRRSLDDFATGRTPVLVSVKALVEGIDVPDADIGFSVASSASVRQRVQSLGRVLRRRFDGSQKSAEMHLLYVHDSVDEAIYGKQDWSDLTGAASNRYYRWPLDVSEPVIMDGPPREPRPTEEQILAGLPLNGKGLTQAVEWAADWPVPEWRLDSRGTLTDLGGRPVTNPQGVAEAVRAIKPSGGRFRVSRSGSVVVPDLSGPTPRAWLVKRLDEPFQFASDAPPELEVSPVPDDERPLLEAPAATGAIQPGAKEPTATDLSTDPAPGDLYQGPTDRALGSYRIRQKAGGVIERRVPGGSQFAGSRDGEGMHELVSNAIRVLDAWRATGETGLTFHVNQQGDAYYVSGGQPRFLANVQAGFAWPSDPRVGGTDGADLNGPR